MSAVGWEGRVDVIQKDVWILRGSSPISSEFQSRVQKYLPIRRGHQKLEYSPGSSTDHLLISSNRNGHLAKIVSVISTDLKTWSSKRLSQWHQTKHFWCHCHCESRFCWRCLLVELLRTTAKIGVEFEQTMTKMQTEAATPPLAPLQRPTHLRSSS